MLEVQALKLLVGSFLMAHTLTPWKEEGGKAPTQASIHGARPSPSCLP